MEIIQEVETFFKEQFDSRHIAGWEIEKIINFCKLYSLELQYLLEQKQIEREQMITYTHAYYKLNNILSRAENILSNYKELNQEIDQLSKEVRITI